MKPRIKIISVSSNPSWVGWWTCGLPTDRPWHYGVGTTPYMAWVDWQVRGVRE